MLLPRTTAQYIQSTQRSYLVLANKRPMIGRLPRYSMHTACGDSQRVPPRRHLKLRRTASQTLRTSMFEIAGQAPRVNATPCFPREAGRNPGASRRLGGNHRKLLGYRRASLGNRVKIAKSWLDSQLVSALLSFGWEYRQPTFWSSLMNSRNSMPTYRRQTLERWADRLGYRLTPASMRTQMKAADRYEPIPRWEVYPSGSQYEASVKGCHTLADVARALDEIAIMQDHNGY